MIYISICLCNVKILETMIWNMRGMQNYEIKISEGKGGTVEVMNDFEILRNGPRHRFEEWNRIVGVIHTC